MASKQNRSRARRLFLERLELRQLLAADWHNPYIALDVNFDGVVAPVDALLGINKINDEGPGPLPALGGEPPSAYYDTSNDGFLSAVDVLGVINALNGLADSPVITAGLMRDTAPGQGTNSDGLTSDARIQGRVAGSLGVASVSVSVNGGAAVNVSVDRTGQFVYDPQLTADGPHALVLRTEDSLRNAAEPVTINLTLDTTVPTVPAFDLASESDSAPIGDQQTTQASVSLVGTTSPAALVSLQGLSRQTTADAATGQFRFDDVPLAEAANPLVAVAEDAAGNASQFSRTIHRITATAQRPPVLEPVGTLNVVVGQVLKVPLQASDPDGDFLHFSIDTLSLQQLSLPTGSLDATGVMTFRPGPGQEGSYAFQVVASDGRFSTKQPVVLNVTADPVQTTRVSGVVHDQFDQPLTGVRVHVGQVSTTTDADGRFQLDFGEQMPPTAVLEIRGDEYAPPAPTKRYAYAALSLVEQLGRAPFAGVNNQLVRPAYVASYDPSTGTVIDPAQATLVTDTAFPGASLYVPAGSLKKANGELYDGPLNLVPVPFDQLPAELPDTFLPDNAVTIQPAGLVFTVAPILRLPNLGRHAFGTFMEGYAANPAAGTFDLFGFGQVRTPSLPAGNGGQGESSRGDSNINNGGPSQTGDVIIIIIKDYSPAPETKKKEEEKKKKEKEECDVGIPPLLGSRSPCGNLDAKAGSGAVKAQETVSSYSSFGLQHSTRLVYDSLTANPNAVIPFSLESASGDSDDRLLARMSVSSGGFVVDLPGDPGSDSQLQRGLNYWSLPTSDAHVRASLLADLSSLPSGEVTYQITAGVARMGTNVPSGRLATTTGSLLNVNRVNSPFGSGWGLAGLQELIPQANGSLLLLDGDGTATLFAPATDAGGKYVSPAGDFSELVRQDDGTFVRRLTNGIAYHFDAANKLSRVVDSNGNTTQYQYGSTGLLTSIRDVVGLETTFAYNEGLLSAVTNPAGITTRFAHDANRNLTNVDHPDGGKCEREYNDKHALTKSDCTSTSSVGLSYGMGDRLTEILLPDGSVRQIQPADLQGLQDYIETSSPDSPPPALPDGPFQARYVDGNGHETFIDVDARGFVISAHDALGSLGQSHYNYNELLTRSHDPQGNVELFTYDGKGNLLSQRDALSTNSIVAGQFTEAGQLFVYRFAVEAGQRFYFESLGEDSAARLRLVQPDGEPVNRFWYPSEIQSFGPFELDVSGEYELQLESDLPGAFRFQMLRASQAQPLTIGTAVQGTLDATFGSELFRFQGQAGQRLFLENLQPDARRATVPATSWMVYGPARQAIQSQFSANGYFDAVLPSSGEYLLMLSTSHATADFSFRVSSPAVRQRDLPFDTQLTDRFRHPGDVIEFPFETSAGQRILFNLLSDVSVAASIDLVNSDGEEVYLPTNSPTTLPPDRYRLVMRGAQAGAMAFELRDLATAPALVSGDTFAGTLARSGQTELYRFTGTAGQNLKLQKMAFSGAASQTQYGWLYLRDPDNQILKSVDLGTDVEVTLPYSGEYVIQTESRNAFLPLGGTLATPFRYEYRVEAMQGTTVPTTGLGEFTGNLATRTEIDTYTFTASAGLPLYFDSLVAPSSGNDPLVVVIKGPNGQTIFVAGSATDKGPFVLPASGTFTISVESNSGMTGDYAFRLLDLSEVPAIGDGVEIAGTTNGDAAQIYRYAAGAGTLRFVNQLTSGGYGEPQQRWLDRAGNRLGPETYGFPLTGFLSFPKGGDYYLVISARAQGTPDYGLRLLDPNAAPAIEVGEKIVGELAPSRATQLYRLENVGPRLFIAGEQIYAGDLSLYDESGSRFTGDTLGRKMSVTLPQKGNYWVAVSSTSSDPTVAYEFTVTEPTVTTVDLSLNTETSGNITEPGAVVAYTFQGTAGQRLYFDGLDLPNRSVSVSAQLHAPSGQGLFFVGTVDNASPFQLPESGTYRLEVTSRDAASYRFRLIDIASVPVVTFDTMVDKTLASSVESDIYRLHGSSGDPYYLAYSVPSAGSFQFYAPDNRRIFPQRGNLPLDGEHVIVIDSFLTAISYKFQVASPTTTVQALPLGMLVAAEIATPGDTYSYSFQGTPGQRLLLTNFPVGTLSPQYRLTGPAGQLVFAPSAQTYLLNEAGTYTLTVTGAGANTGNFRFRLDDLSAAPSLSVTTAIAGTLNSVEDFAVYRLAATAGQRLRLQFTTTPANAAADWSIYDPFATSAYSGNTSANATFDANLLWDGSYALVLRGKTSPFDYQVSVTDISDPAVEVSGLNERFQGTLDAQGQTTLTFTAPAGQMVYFDPLQEPSLFNALTLELLGPENQRVRFLNGFDDGPIVLPRSGTYQVSIRNNSQQSANTYDFRLVDLSNLAPLTMNEPVFETLDPGRWSQVYRITGQAGKRLLFVREAGNAPTVFARIVSGQGSTYGATSMSSEPNSPFRLAHDTPYYLVITSTSDQPTDFGFTLYDVDAIRRTELGTTVQGTKAAGSQARVYAVEARAGERLYFDNISMSPDWDGSLDAFGSGNERLAEESYMSLGKDVAVEATRDGTYLFVLSANQGTELDYEFRLLKPKTTRATLSLAGGEAGKKGNSYEPTFSQPVEVRDELGRRLLYEVDPQTGNRLSATQVVGVVGGNDDPITRYTYNAQGLMTSTTDPLGRVTGYEYDAFGRVATITFAQGTALQAQQKFEYDLAGNVTAFIDELGRRTVYHYDTKNRLTGTDYPDPDGAGPLAAPQIRQAYDTSGNILSTIDSLGRITTYAYDDLNRLLQRTDPAPGGTTRYEYDANGNLAQIIDPLSRITSHEYDGRNRAIRVTDPTGAITRYEYDVNGNVVRTIDGRGNATVKEYDARDRKVKTVDPLGHATVTTYDAANQVIAYTDANKNTTTWTYDDLERLVSVVDAVGNAEHYTYDLAGNQTEVRDVLGRSTNFTYDARNRRIEMTDALQGRTQYTFDAVGNLLRLTDARNNSTQFAYDGLNRRVQSMGPDGSLTSWNYDANGNVTTITDPLGHVTQFTYDALDRRIAATDALGHTTHWEFDRAGNIIATIDAAERTTHFTYDGMNRLSEVRNALEGVTKTAYDAAGNVTSVTDARGNQTTFVYDAANQLIQTTDPLGGTRRFTYDPAGNRVTATDPLNRVTRHQYDALHRLTQVTDALDGVQKYRYDAAGNLIEQEDQLGRITTLAYDPLDRPVTLTNPLQGARTLVYDAVGNVIRSTDELGRETGFAFDALNRQTEIFDALQGRYAFEYDLAGRLIKETDPLGQTTTYEYDALSRLKTVEDPLQHTTQFTYDAVGNQLSVSDALGHVQSTVYDALNRPVAFTDPAGGITRLEYDAVGNRTKFIDPLGNSTSYTFDALNRLLTETNALQASRNLTYDAVGNLTRLVDRNGRVRTFAYDFLDRPVEENWLNGSGDSVHRIEHTYDAVGQLNQAVDALSSYSFAYDTLGRLTEWTNGNTPGAPLVTFSFTYDAVGNRLSRVDTLGQQAAGTTSYAYDALNRMTRITQSGPSVDEKRVDFSYDPLGRFQEVKRYADVTGATLAATSTYTFDAASRLTGLEHAKGVTSLASYHWTFDAADRITKVVDTEGATDFTYDHRNQLLSAVGGESRNESFAYDASGNRLGPDNQIGGANRLLSDGTYDYVYDAEGNIVRRTELATGNVTEYKWDHRNRLAQVTLQDSEGHIARHVTYTYDMFDRRIAKSVDLDGQGPRDAVIERFVHDGADLALEFDGPGQLARRYLHGPLIDQVLAEEDAAGETRWLLTDNLGSVRDVVDAAGELVDHLVYDSFGQIVSQSDSEFTHRFTYTGREWDEETGLYYYRARYYDAALGRFLSEDPLGFGGGDANVYRYVGNSPLNNRDPLGLFPGGGPIPGLQATGVGSFDPYQHSPLSKAAMYADLDRLLAAPVHPQLNGGVEANQGYGQDASKPYLQGNLEQTQVTHPLQGGLEMNVPAQGTKPLPLVPQTAKLDPAGFKKPLQGKAREDHYREPADAHHDNKPTVKPKDNQKPKDEKKEPKDEGGECGGGPTAGPIGNPNAQKSKRDPKKVAELDRLCRMRVVLTELLSDEGSMGTWQTAVKWSNTWGYNKMGRDFDNGVVPGRDGRAIDIDWLADLITFTRDPKHVDDWYQFGKAVHDFQQQANGVPLWATQHAMGKLVQALTKDPNRPYEVTQAPRHLPYVDPKEIAMLDAFRRGHVTFRDQLDNLRPLNKKIRDLQLELGIDCLHRPLRK